MNDATYFYLPKAYEVTDEFCKIPYDCKDLEILSKDTTSPQFNSIEYKLLVRQMNNVPNDYLPVFGYIDCSEGVVVLGSNCFTNYELESNVVLANNFETFLNMDPLAIKWKLPRNNIISALKCLGSTLVRINRNCFNGVDDKKRFLFRW